MSDYTEAGDLVYADWGGDVRVTVDQCLRCGALVPGSAWMTHDAWHEAVTRD